MEEDDLISDLPESIIESILTKLPIRDAVKTSVLGTRWRHRWASMTHLVFDDRSAKDYTDRSIVQKEFVNFITKFLFLHDGLIRKFCLSCSYLESSPSIYQWLFFISRKDVKELIIKLGEDEWFRVPSCLFSLENLVGLNLACCEFNCPPDFKGFMLLKCLILQRVVIPQYDAEFLISSCPLLETLAVSYYDSLELTIHAPKLKNLILQGDFKDLCLANTPQLVTIFVDMGMNNDVAEHFPQISGCNFDKVIGGAPKLEKLTGLSYFTKSSSNTSAAAWDLDLKFWDKNFSDDCTLHELKIVELSNVSGIPLEMRFIKFLLEHSPGLEEMSIKPSLYMTEGRMQVLIDLVSFRRASPQASIIFVHDQH